MEGRIILAKKAQTTLDPVKVVGCVMILELLIVPPALASVLPKMAKKTMGAMTLLKAKKYWTLVYGIQRKGSCKRK